MTIFELLYNSGEKLFIVLTWENHHQFFLVKTFTFETFDTFDTFTFDVQLNQLN